VHIKRTVGYVQIALGMMLIFACFIVPDMIFKKQNKAVEDISYIMNEVTKQKYSELNITISEKERMEQVRLISEISVSRSITNWLVIYSSAIIVFVLAIMMIFQGIANTRIGSDEDISSKELGKFVVTFFLICYVITSIYLIFFEGPKRSILINSITYLVILIAFAGIVLLFRRIIKKIEAKKADAEQKKP